MVMVMVIKTLRYISGSIRGRVEEVVGIRCGKLGNVSPQTLYRNEADLKD